MEDPKTVSPATLRRLPRYLYYLRTQQARGATQISASKVAEDLDIQHTQVRKDFAATGAEGTPKVGHDIVALIRCIETFLNWDDSSDAILVGVGHLGTALLGYRGFAEIGIRLVAAFDADSGKIGTKVHGFEVQAPAKLQPVTRRLGAKIGILTTPQEVAQATAEKMVDAGILAIWNFAPVRLNLPESIIVENMEMQASLAILSFNLKQKLARPKTPRRPSR